MPKYEMVMVAEMKNYRIGGPEMDKLVGSAVRARRRNRPATLCDVVLFCRGYTPEAASRAKELERELQIRISFKVL